MSERTDNRLPDAAFYAGTPEATRHNKLKFLENRLLEQATFALSRLKTEGGRAHVRRGLIRRHMMMQASRIEIREKTVKRREPLDPYLATALAIHLNAYYLNLKGGLDNLAWALTYEMALLPVIDETNRKTQGFCTLAGKDFRQKLTAKASGLAMLLDAAAPWFEDLKRFRDPAAHRLPLTLVSAMLTEEDRQRHEELKASALAAFEAGDWERGMNLNFGASRLGHFVPIMEAPVHKEGEFYIAPNQVATDQEMFVPLASLIIGVLSA